MNPTQRRRVKIPPHGHISLDRFHVPRMEYEQTSQETEAVMGSEQA
jgi:hypothetical protein